MATIPYACLDRRIAAEAKTVVLGNINWGERDGGSFPHLECCMPHYLSEDSEACLSSCLYFFLSISFSRFLSPPLNHTLTRRLALPHCEGSKLRCLSLSLRSFEHSHAILSPVVSLTRSHTCTYRRTQTRAHQCIYNLPLLSY